MPQASLGSKLSRHSPQNPLVSCSVEDQLELLCEDKSCTVIPSAAPPPSTNSEDFEQQMNQLIHDKDVSPASSLSLLRDQENIRPPMQAFEFTPDTMAGSLNWQFNGTK